MVSHIMIKPAHMVIGKPIAKIFSCGAAREEKTFDDLIDAQWFERAMKRSQYITTLMKVKG